MGNSEIAKEKLEDARYQVNSDEIVVNGARITCSCTKGKKKNFISVQDGHGIMENGNNCAHDGSCIPIDNIAPFSYCNSIDTKKALYALLPTASPEAKKRYDIALKIILDNESSYSYTPVPCTLPLLDRWFDADEKDYVTDIMKMDVEIKQMIRDFKGKLDRVVRMLNTYYGMCLVTVLYAEPDTTVKERIEYGSIMAKLEYIKKEITDLCKHIFKTLNTKVQAQGDDFSSVVKQLEGVREDIGKMLGYWDEIPEIYKLFEDYETIKSELNGYVTEINEMIRKASEWKEKEYHLITTKSFLICRCGGIITFLDSGQEYGKIINTIMVSILTAIGQFKEYCQENTEKYSYKKADWVTRQKASSYKTAAAALGKFESLVFGNSGNVKVDDACVYMEIMCHSYNDEVKNLLLSGVTLASLASNIITFASAFYTLYDMEESTKGYVDGISADISSLETFKIISTNGGSFIVKANTLYGIVNGIFGFYYVSNDTWIETIRITVFTDNYALVSERKLNEKGELDRKKFNQIYSRAAYSRGYTGMGLGWKEEPGAYLARRVHKDDNGNRRKEIENGAQIQEELLP